MQNNPTVPELLTKISELEQENNDLRNRLSIRNRDIQNDQRDLFFARVLGSGYYTSADSLIRAGAVYDIEFSNPCYAVLVCEVDVLSNKNSLNLDRGMINFILRNTLENCFDFPCYAADVKNQTVAILNLPECNYVPEQVFDILNGALGTLNREYSLVIRVAISRVYPSALNLNHAMCDSENVLEYLEMMGIDQQITGYDSLTHPHMEQLKFSFLEYVTKLLGYIRTNDVAGIRKHMREMLSQELYIAPPTIDIFRFRMYGIVNTMLFLLEDLRGTIPNEFYEIVNPGPRLTHASTLEELMVVLDDILIQMEHFVNGNQTAIAPVWGEQIRDYVLEQFRDPDLTVASLADYFNITPTYCSRMFKQATNQRLFDFIQLTRLDAAKKLLPSELSLTAIAESCGFSSALTMSRAFKRYEGAAPSALRGVIK